MNKKKNSYIVLVVLDIIGLGVFWITPYILIIPMVTHGLLCMSITSNYYNSFVDRTINKYGIFPVGYKIVTVFLFTGLFMIMWASVLYFIGMMRYSHGF